MSDTVVKIGAVNPGQSHIWNEPFMFQTRYNFLIEHDSNGGKFLAILQTGSGREMFVELNLDFAGLSMNGFIVSRCKG